MPDSVADLERHGDAVRGDAELLRERAHRKSAGIKIDSTAVGRSQAKLELARDRGVLAIWLRWKSGTTLQLPGVRVVDLRSTAVEPEAA